MCLITKIGDQEKTVIEMFHTIRISFEIFDVLPQRTQIGIIHMVGADLSLEKVVEQR